MTVTKPPSGLDLLLEAVAWREIPRGDTAPGEVFATHRGVLTVAGEELRVYRMNDGRRLIDAEDAHRFFGWGSK